MPVNPLLLPVMSHIARGKAVCQAIHGKLGTLILEEPKDRSSDSGSHYESEPEGQQSEDFTSEDELEKEELIPKLTSFRQRAQHAATDL